MQIVLYFAMYIQSMIFLRLWFTPLIQIEPLWPAFKKKEVHGQVMAAHLPKKISKWNHGLPVPWSLTVQGENR